MSKKSDNYKQGNNSRSLTLPVNFLRLNNVDVVIDAYNILITKGRRKTAYIIEAIEYLDSLPERNEFLNAFGSKCRIAQLAKEIYKLDTDEDVEQLLSTSTKTKKFKNIDSQVPDIITPKKILLGFKKGDPVAEAMHKRLCDLSVNERVMLISKAVSTYVLDGKDEEMNVLNAHRIVRDLIVEIKNNPEKKDQIIHNFKLMLQYNN